MAASGTLAHPPPELRVVGRPDRALLAVNFANPLPRTARALGLLVCETADRALLRVNFVAPLQRRLFWLRLF